MQNWVQSDHQSDSKQTENIPPQNHPRQPRGIHQRQVASGQLRAGARGNSFQPTPKGKRYGYQTRSS